MHTTYALPISCKGIVIEDGKVWLRYNERNEWELPGGKLDPGEQPEVTVAREMLEELGVEVTVGLPLANHVYIIRDSVDESHGVYVSIYMCRFIKRVGDVETVGEAGATKFASFDVFEISDLPMPDFYNTAIKFAYK